MDFGQPNVEIGQKMANGQLLFLTLLKNVTHIKQVLSYQILIQPVQVIYMIHTHTPQEKMHKNEPKMIGHYMKWFFLFFCNFGPGHAIT